MNSYERVHAAVRREPTDCVPVAPYMGNHGAVVAGVRLQDYYTRAAVMAQAQYDAWTAYGQDMLCVQSDNYYMAEGFGVRVEYHPDSTPTFSAPAVGSLADVARLRVPDPQRDGRMPVYLEAIARLRHRVGGQVIIRASGTGPFSMAGHLMGTQAFLIELAKAEHGLEGGDPAGVHALLDLGAEALIAFCLAELDAGADIVQCGDSLASLDVISPAMYQKYVYPYEQKVFSRLQPAAQAHGALMLLHICGNNTPVMYLHADTGADILEVDYKSDLGTWKQAVGDKVALIGNLNPTQVLLQGTIEEVRRASEACIAAAGAGGGFILGSGCEVPPAAPHENLMEMIRVARSYRL